MVFCRLLSHTAGLGCSASLNVHTFVCWIGANSPAVKNKLNRIMLWWIFYPFFGTEADLAGLSFMNPFHSALFNKCTNCCPNCVYIYICDSMVLRYVNFPLRRSVANPWAKISFAFSRNILHSLSHRFGNFAYKLTSPLFSPLACCPFLLCFPPKSILLPSQQIAFPLLPVSARQGQVWWILVLPHWGLSHRTCPISACPNSCCCHLYLQ